MILPWILCVILLLTVALLAIKLAVMRNSINEITNCVSEYLSLDTNLLITVSSNDKYVKKLARELNRNLSELRKLERLYRSGDRELKETVTNISHDLRTPLTAIYGYLDLLEKEEKSETVARYIKQIENRVVAMNRLAEELFRYSVFSSVCVSSPERLNLCRALEESLVSFYGALEQRGITPHIKIPETAVWRVCDADALSRVFGNIIGNAVKYSDGDLTVDMTEDGVITFSNAASSLSPVEVGKLFDRFFTVDTARKSTGLGLAIAKTLVEQMNGKVTAGYLNGRLNIQVSFL